MTMTVARVLSIAALSASVGTGLVAAPSAQAGSPAAHPAGGVTVASCTSLPATTTFTPGLHRNLPRATAATLSGDLSGCTDVYGDDLSGVGSIEVQLHGTSAFGAVAESGTFVITWPQALGPSSGSLAFTGPAADGRYHADGRVTSGPYVGAAVSATFAQVGTNPGATGRRGHLLTQQTLADTAPLTLAAFVG